MRLLPFDEGLGDIAGYKTVLVRVTGYNFASVIYGPENFASVVSSHLSANNIGVNSVRLGQASNSVTGYYDLLLSINALASQDDNTIKSLIYQSIIGDLNSISVDVINTSQISPADVPSDPNSFSGNLGLGLGISTPIAIGGAALLALILLRR